VNDIAQTLRLIFRNYLNYFFQHEPPPNRRTSTAKNFLSKKYLASEKYRLTHRDTPISPYKPTQKMLMNNFGGVFGGLPNCWSILGNSSLPANRI